MYHHRPGECFCLVGRTPPRRPLARTRLLRCVRSTLPSSPQPLVAPFIRILAGFASIRSWSRTDCTCEQQEIDSRQAYSIHTNVNKKSNGPSPNFSRSMPHSFLQQELFPNIVCGIALNVCSLKTQDLSKGLLIN